MSKLDLFQSSKFSLLEQIIVKTQSRARFVVIITSQFLGPANKKRQQGNKPPTSPQRPLLPANKITRGELRAETPRRRGRRASGSATVASWTPLHTVSAGNTSAAMTREGPRRIRTKIGARTHCVQYSAQIRSEEPRARRSARAVTVRAWMRRCFLVVL